MVSSDWRNQIFEEKKKKIGGPNLGQVGQIGPETSFFASFSFPWNCILW